MKKKAKRKVTKRDRNGEYARKLAQKIKHLRNENMNLVATVSNLTRRLFELGQ